MFQTFFKDLRAAKIPVTIREYLTLLEALDKDVPGDSVDGFYYLSRTALVKDERDLDKFDQVFSHVFRGMDYLSDIFGEDEHELPADWLRAMAEKHLSPEEMAEIEALGDFDKIMEALKERLENQDKRHEGGNKNIGTAQGWLDIKMRPERRNAVKVLAMFDIGGSMDAYVKQAEELFSAARSEFKRLEYFYFHNCFYEHLWKDNIRRMKEVTPTWDVLHKFPSDYRVVIVGDAAMSPYEITMRGGSVEHWNEEAGAVWLKRIVDVYPHLIWINPTEEKYWAYSQSTQIIQDIIGKDRMFAMTLSGLESAMKELAR